MKPARRGSLLSQSSYVKRPDFETDGMHMIERKQDALQGAMLRALMAEHLREEREKVQN